MSSIYDIPYEDIKIFLRANKTFKTKNESYDIANKLLKNKKSIGHTTNIIEWMIAHNLLIRKINIHNYTIYEIDKLSQNEINKLAKLLTMNGNNVDNIKNILKYLHKLDENVNMSNNQNLTIAGEAIYNIILSNMWNKDLNKMNLNRYSKLYLEDQKFWENRLREIFHLKTKDKNFDYKFAVKFLDNGKSLDENYHEALKKGLKQIVKLLIDNQVVKDLEAGHIDRFFENQIITDESVFTGGLYKLSKLKYESYQVFIKNIYDDFIEENEFENLEDFEKMGLDYFNEIIYTKDTVAVELPLLSFNGSDGFLGVPDYKIFTLRNTNGFTAGEILYKLSQKLPNAEDLSMFSELILKYDDPLKIIDELENIKNEIRYNIILDYEVKNNKITFIDEYLIQELNTLIHDEEVLSNWKAQIRELIEWYSNSERPTEPYSMYDYFLSYNGINNDASPSFLNYNPY